MAKVLKWSLATLLLLGGVAFGVWKILIDHRYDGNAPVRVFIPAQASPAAVADSLGSSLGHKFGSMVTRLWKLQDGNSATAHGSYLVQPGERAVNVARRQATGRQSPIRLTFNNLRTFGDLAAHVGSHMEIDSADFAAAADSLLPAKGFRPAEYAAAFMPDTYEYYWTAGAERVINTMLDARNRFWNQERLDKANRLGLTPAQVAIVASIVEEETARPDERPLVARLYLNRLAKGMKLQADPTVKFALGDFGLRRILARHLTVDSPYNTYKIDGLPPGPIRIVEGSSIDAVLDAPAHSYIYMCARADFSGYHDFATSYDRHRINAARYQRALDSRGIQR